MSQTATRPADGQDDMSEQRRMYWRFGAMIATSTTVMFLLTYTNSIDVLGHAHFSQERLYMALLMGGTMAVVMLGFMWGMYKDTRTNIAIMVGSLVLAATALVFSRQQVMVDDSAYMAGMIPHHSIAILTSERADIEDVRVRELADEIIAAQRREIEEMERLLADIDAHGPATTWDEAVARDDGLTD